MRTIKAFLGLLCIILLPTVCIAIYLTPIITIITTYKYTLLPFLLSIIILGVAELFGGRDIERRI
jgi:hypothetical protein